MSAMVQLGPLMLPTALLLMLACVAAGSLAARWQAGRAGAGEMPLMRVLLAGLLAARLAFVWRHREAYLQSPWDVLDIRDGGWLAWAGFAGAWACGLWFARRRGPRRRPLLAGLAAATLVWAVGAAALGIGAPAATKAMPPLQLAAPDGAPRSLAAFAGKPVVLNLWASWCPPCRREMPMLQRMQAARPDVHFVFVNQGEDAQQVNAYLRELGMPLRNVLLDPDTQAGAYFGHRALPATLFFDAQGRLVDTRLGELSQASLAQRLGALRATP
ncbi:TlpA family protein disulfide reductase [Bordetella genomosp. 6]|uniref:TlpA family protein disulfide reductase n=1 Tax=Bordetella genomosp. 6 TaxID=463024 RepID=UPI000A28FBCE|nr:TlpA disulfide reductase family protein [Bordetella genomosp. 6]ARP79220.1 thiol:disulfide interchange protein [Bordetella genomosp. 6]